MTIPRENLELSPATLRGATVSVEYHNAQTILRTEQRNPRVVFEVYAGTPGILSGMRDVLAFLRVRLPAIDSTVQSLSDGDAIGAGETLLRISAPYASFGIDRNLITGILASGIGWATAASECVRAADGTRVIVNGAAHIHPQVVGAMEYSAYIGGCAAVSTEKGGEITSTVPIGSFPQDFVLIWGAANRAMTVYHRHSRVGVQRVIPVPTVGDSIQEALDAAYALSGGPSNRLRAVKMNVPENLGGGMPSLARELRARLDDAGFRNVEIWVEGDLTPELIREYKASAVDVNMFFVGRYIAGASPVPLTAGIKEIDGEAVAPRGMLPGRIQNPRLLEQDLGVPERDLY